MGLAVQLVLGIVDEKKWQMIQTSNSIMELSHINEV